MIDDRRLMIDAVSAGEVGREEFWSGMPMPKF